MGGNSNIAVTLLAKHIDPFDGLFAVAGSENIETADNTGSDKSGGNEVILASFMTATICNNPCNNQ
ncbi:hypothetical protein GCM10022421_20830 [Oceanisphaera sediminis]|uniref:Uncharacterized protein n=1 Tax=Oceanisphaera sediminis TaxID=981381 RepID=A0ABP7E4X2_9GAMM